MPEKIMTSRELPSYHPDDSPEKAVSDQKGAVIELVERAVHLGFLNTRHAIIISQRFGLFGEAMSIAEIAKEQGVSDQRVSKIIQIGLERIDAFAEKLGFKPNIRSNGDIVSGDETNQGLGPVNQHENTARQREIEAALRAEIHREYELRTPEGRHRHEIEQHLRKQQKSFQREQKKPYYPHDDDTD